MHETTEPKKDLLKAPSLAALIPPLVVPLIGSLFYFVWLPGNGAGQVGYTLTKLFTLIYPLCFAGWWHIIRQRPQASLKPIFLWGIGSGLFISLAGFALWSSPLGNIVRENADSILAKGNQLGFKEHFFLFAFFICIFHSALEEFYWRGFVFGNLRKRLGKVPSHLLAAIGFAAHHFVLTCVYFGPVFALFLSLAVATGGLIWSILYQKQGSLLGCWISHLLVDAFLMFITYQLMF